MSFKINCKKGPLFTIIFSFSEQNWHTYEFMPGQEVGWIRIITVLNCMPLNAFGLGIVDVGLHFIVFKLSGSKLGMAIKPLAVGSSFEFQSKRNNLCLLAYACSQAGFVRSCNGRSTCQWRRGQLRNGRPRPQKPTSDPAPLCEKAPPSFSRHLRLLLLFVNSQEVEARFF